MHKKEDQLRQIKLKEIRENPHQPRKDFSLEELEELAASIQEIGLIHPPVVRELSSGQYELIAGERRLRALQLLKYATIPVIVRHEDSPYSAHSALIENIQRVDLNPVEIAASLHNLMQRFQLTQEQLADRVGKKRSTVANYLRLLQLPSELQASIREGKISMGHAKALLALEGEKQKRVQQEIIKNGWSVRQTEREVQRLIKKKSNKASEKRDLFIQDLQKQLEHRFGAKVLIAPQGKGGKIAISYYDLDDLDRLLQLMEINA